MIKDPPHPFAMDFLSFGDIELVEPSLSIGLATSHLTKISIFKPMSLWVHI